MAATRSLAVFASGSGTNLQALLDTFGPDGRPDDAARVALVVSDRPGIGALERAEKAGVPTRIVAPHDYSETAEFGAALLETLAEHDTELIALAGYLRLLPQNLVRAFRGRIVNIHPGPLPAFGGKGMYGIHVHEAVLESGVRVSGPTVHFVDERYDRGPIIAQWPVPVHTDDTPETLAARVLRYEHRLYPAVIRALARGWIALEDGNRVTSSLDRAHDAGFVLADDEARALGSVEDAWARD